MHRSGAAITRTRNGKNGVGSMGARTGARRISDSGGALCGVGSAEHITPRFRTAAAIVRNNDQDTLPASEQQSDECGPNVAHSAGVPHTSDELRSDLANHNSFLRRVFPYAPPAVFPLSVRIEKSRDAPASGSGDRSSANVKRRQMRT